MPTPYLPAVTPYPGNKKGIKAPGQAFLTPGGAFVTQGIAGELNNRASHHSCLFPLFLVVCQGTGHLKIGSTGEQGICVQLSRYVYCQPRIPDALGVWDCGCCASQEEH